MGGSILVEWGGDIVEAEHAVRPRRAAGTCVGQHEGTGSRVLFEDGIRAGAAAGPRKCTRN